MSMGMAGMMLVIAMLVVVMMAKIVRGMICPVWACGSLSGAWHGRRHRRASGSNAPRSRSRFAQPLHHRLDE